MSMRNPAGFISAFYDPLKTPDAPTIGTATGGNALASVVFTAPSNVGGSAITAYSVVSTPGGFVGTGASSPVTVSGLTNGTAYTFKVFATNSYGPSVVSAASNSVSPVQAIGDAFGGGFYAGQIGVAGVATHYIIVGPLASAQTSGIAWKNANTATTGADSFIDGPQNTADMVAGGSSTVYPSAHFCNNVTTGGFSDWYMPAINELEVCYYGLKPTTTTNNTAVGTNTNAVPSRGSNYTSGTPAQTSAAAFVTSTGAEAFTADYYWSSTEYSSAGGWSKHFGNASQYYGYSKLSPHRVRAIRRVAV